MTTMNWSPQQAAAIEAVRAWVKSGGPQVFRLFGYAGSGKTTLAKTLAQDIGIEVAYGAYTGKAALVMQSKGCYGASTLHSLIYQPRVDGGTGKVDFVLRDENPFEFEDLLVVDEVSMVGEQLALDLLSFGQKVLVLGDPAQLPPVKGEGYFINATPEVMLTEIHRQAAENPIIRMSIDVREGRGLKVGEYGSSLVTQQSKLSRNQLTDQVMSADQMLCGTNATRVALNARMRRVKGFSGTPKAEFPVVGDRLVCLRNKRDMGLLNGSLWDVKQVEYAPGGRSSVSTLKMVVDSADGAGLSGVEVEVPEHFFLGTDKDLDWRQKAAYQEFTYGYALTVHKAQGSQWDNVLLFDESRVFRDDAQKHLYTAVTRAAEKVVVLQ